MTINSDQIENNNNLIAAIDLELADPNINLAHAKVLWVRRETLVEGNGILHKIQHEFDEGQKVIDAQREREDAIRRDLAFPGGLFGGGMN